MRKRILVAAVAALLTTGAHAASLVVTYYGVVGAGTDVNNAFGFGAGTSMYGKDYQLSLSYDIETYTYQTLETQHSLWNSAGGTASATLQIGTGSLTMRNIGYGNAVYRSRSGPSNPQLMDTHVYLDGNDQAGANSYVMTGGLFASLNLFTPIDYYYTPYDSVSSSFALDGNGYGLVARHVTSSVVASPAPEPASWAMVIGGFGLVGGAMRRRRAAAPFARP